MGYVGWCFEKTGKGEETQAKKEDAFYYWQDLVTNTQYFISIEDYNRIYAAGKEELAQCWEGDDLKGMEEVFYEPKGTDDISLFAVLPYMMEGMEKCVRICDYVCFRTACLYALRYGSMKRSADIEREKRKVRMQGLLWEFVSGVGDCPELEQVKQMMQSVGQGADFNIAQHKADVVKGGTVKIKQYYLETNKIPEIQGASILLDTVNLKKMQEAICRLHIRESLIYAGGGKMMAILPEGCGEEICQEMERLVERETVTALSNFCSHPFEMGRLFHDYQGIVEEMDLILEERQGLRWDFRTEPQVDWSPKEMLKGTGFCLMENKREDFCTSCRNRFAIAKRRRNGTEEKLCQSCLYKNLAGGRDSNSRVYQEYRDYVREKKGAEVEVRGNSYQKLEEIAENGFIGVIYGDANSMSKQINSLDSFQMMRYFSQTTSDAVKDIVFDALYENLQQKPSFRIIAVGRDDIFLIVPGKRAFDIACSIGEQFDQRFRNRSKDENGITMSMGVCITHYNMPVQYSFEIAQKLLKSAKQKAWEECGKGNVTGTLDWMAIENEMPGSGDLEFQRRGGQGKPRKTLRPYTWSQAKAMKRFLKAVKEEKSFVFQLRQSWYQHTKEEAELFYEYQISKKENTSVRSAMNRLAEGMGGRAVKNNILCQGEAYSPWVDAIEIWDYMEGME